MQHIIIENTLVRVSRLALGTASMHRLLSSVQRRMLLEAAAAAGITHFDTSPYYGYGLAECDVGHFLQGQRSGYTVATKVGLYPWGFADGQAASVWLRKGLGKMVPSVSRPVVDWRVSRARASLRESLRRLKTGYVDFLFLHEPDKDLIDSDEFMRWIEWEVSSGTVRSWGVAGVAESVAPWLNSGHPLARVVQTQDSLDNRQADFMLRSGRSLQFTYGYLTEERLRGKASTPEEILRNALARNTTGAVITSTRRAERIAGLARSAE